MIEKQPFHGQQSPMIRTFDTGATRDQSDTKLDFEGFISPIVLQRFAEYMHAHRVQSNGELRESDNWQKGMPVDEYFKSLLRHVHAAWMLHRGYPANDEQGRPYNMQDELCAIFFNVQGLIYESERPF